MTIHDEQDFRDRLAVALDEFTPGPFPLHAVVSRGKRVAVRRRVAAGTIAAIAAAAVATPVLLHQVAAPPGQVQPSQGRRIANWPPKPAPSALRYHVTVRSPGPGSQPGLIASGRVDGTPWRVTGTFTGPGQPSLCINVTVPSSSSSECTFSQPAMREPPLASRHGVPADLGAQGPPAQLIVTGTVRTDVAYLRVSLSNGQALTLRPVAIFGRKYARYVAFSVPRATSVTLIRAYSRHGELAYAVPFTLGSSLETVRWISPGQPARPSPAAYEIGSGDVAGTHWALDLYTGPWGSCFVSGSTECMPDNPSELPAGHPVRDLFATSAAGRGRAAYLSVVTVARSVGYLTITEPDGSVTRIGVVTAAGGRLAAYTWAPGGVTRWTAYSPDGARLGSGRVRI